MIKRRRNAFVIVVASGRGGTGKSLLAANIGAFLANLGRDVMLVDAALGAPSLHTVLGVAPTERGMRELITDTLLPADFNRVAVSTTITNLRLVSADRDGVGAGIPSPFDISRVKQGIELTNVEVMIVDVGPGAGALALELFAMADAPVLVLTPEPTSFTSGIRFLKSSWIRSLRSDVFSTLGIDPNEVAPGQEGGLYGPRDLWEVAEEHGQASELRAEMRNAMQQYTPYIVLNGVRSKADMDLGPAVCTAIFRRLGLGAKFLGSVEFDDVAWVSLKRKRPFVIDYPESRAAKCVEKLARRVISVSAENALEWRDQFTHYEYLDVEPSASEEEIRRAYRRQKQLYASDSVFIGGLYNEARLEELYRKMDLAYCVLMDPLQRKPYDASLFPDGIPVAQSPEFSMRLSSRSEISIDRPPAPDLEPDTAITGALLQQIRESKGLDLRDISERTKIGLTYLVAIEHDHFEKLPPAVYVRGFLVEYCRILGLSAERVLSTYYQNYLSALVTREQPS